MAVPSERLWVYSLDPVQVTQMARYLETVYVSGWQSSSTASSTHEPGPDLAGPFLSDLFQIKLSRLIVQLQITPITPSQTKSSTCSPLNSSTTGNNAKLVLVSLTQNSPRLPSLITCDLSLPTLTLAMAVSPLP